jgi:hypothetical protein
MEYNRVLAMPWDSLNWEQQAESLQLAYRAGHEIGTERAEQNNDTAETTFTDFDMYLLQDPEFNEDDGPGPDQPDFMNDWKPNYWANRPLTDLRVIAFIAACEDAKEQRRRANVAQ